MPFRKFYAGRGSNHPVAYSILTLAVGALACMVISVTISVTASNKAIRQNEAQEAEEAQRAAALAERSKQAVCLLISKMSAVYNDETAPATETGRAAGLAWQELHKIFRCDEG
jgi:hypothetical protein